MTALKTKYEHQKKDYVSFLEKHTYWDEFEQHSQIAKELIALLTGWMIIEVK
ncbi:hypothetical protein WDW89_10370 [Deltaproteobacteria bacterium TL4]